MNTKVIALYLPQYHRIPENDKFWGEGFTDWVTVKNAKKLFEGHKQPRVPLNDNYYDLSLKENVAWQAKLAKEHGIYGFGIYHYWFNNEQNLLTKPAEIIRENDDIDINYCFVWDNCVWKRSWSNVKGGNAWAPAYEQSHHKKDEPEILIPYILGTENDWTNHYSYLSSYFKDTRYIRKDNKPVFVILHYDSQIAKMCEYWNQLAVQDGFEGISFIFRYDIKEICDTNSLSMYKYEPIFSGWTNCGIYGKIKNRICRNRFLRIYDYDTIWGKILKEANNANNNILPCAFVSYDDTPRRGKKGIVIKSSSPSKFKKYFSELMSISAKQDKEYIFLTAWNEWGEGAYLEPDTENGYEYLNVIKEIQNEFII